MAQRISTSHYTGREQNDLHHIRKRIAQNLRPALLFCYGNRVTSYLQRSCFLQKKRKEHIGAAYDLLMVLDNHDPLNPESAEIIVQRLIGDRIKITMTVLSISELSEKLAQGNFFLSRVVRSALVLINRNNSLSQTDAANDKSAKVELNSETWLAADQNIHHSKKHLEQAKDYFKNVDYGESLASVTQSILHASKALLCAGLGYEIEPLHLEKAIRLSLHFTRILSDLFPANTQEERVIYACLTQRETNKEALPALLPVLIHRATELKQTVHNYLYKNNTLLQYDPEKPDPGH